MEYIYATLILDKLGIDINEDNIVRLIKNTGIEPNIDQIRTLLNALNGVNIKETLAASISQPAKPEPTKTEESIKAEPKQEMKVDENLTGLDTLFGGM